MAHSGHVCGRFFMFVLLRQNGMCVLIRLRNSRLFVNFFIVSIKQNTIKLINIFIYAHWNIVFIESFLYEIETHYVTVASVSNSLFLCGYLQIRPFQMLNLENHIPFSIDQVTFLDQ